MFIKQNKSMNNFIYTIDDIRNLENQTMYSSFGNMINSTKPTLPSYKFGTSDRQKRKKMYNSQQIAKTDFIGKLGQGPAAYYPEFQKLKISDGNLQKQIQIKRGNNKDKFEYPIPPRTIFNKKQRQLHPKPKYYYYNNREDIQFCPDQADKTRRCKSLYTKFGLQTKLHNQRYNKKTPGPQYNIGDKPQAKKYPQYSFGYRRKVKGLDPFISKACTNQKVGPATYHTTKTSQFISKQQKKSIIQQIANIPYTSIHKKPPSHLIGKGPKIQKIKKGYDNVTYDNKNKTCSQHYDFDYDGGKGLKTYIQIDLKKLSKIPLYKQKMLSYTFGKEKRTNTCRGQFSQFMSFKPMTVRIEHTRI